ncbi:unnamed protein product [Clavelina lepadiformis]|uniref:Bromo domain-containing protein n=1 Tax=Clavelina lepadiformis TaxID=159417 RepID=A0ABP0F997_CLALP
MNPDVEWSTREKLAIASFVYHSGDQHWSGSVSRMLRRLGELNRPPDWFSPKNCAQQYTALLEAAETPRRKRGERTESSESSSSSSSMQTPSVSEAIVRKLTQERTEELRKLIRVERNKYKKFKHTLEQIQSGELDDKLDDMLADIQRTQTEKEDAEKKTDEKPPSSSVTSTEVSHTPNIVKVKTPSADRIDTIVSKPDAVKNVSPKDKQPPQDVEELEMQDNVESMKTEGSEDIQDTESKPDNTSVEMEVVQDVDEDSFPAPPHSSRHSSHVSTSTIEKEENISSPSNQTLPTPTPVIESDSDEVEEEEEEDLLKKGGHEDSTVEEVKSVSAVCDIVMENIIQENISTENKEQSSQSVATQSAPESAISIYPDKQLVEPSDDVFSEKLENRDVTNIPKEDCLPYTSTEPTTVTAPLLQKVNPEKITTPVLSKEQNESDIKLKAVHNVPAERKQDEGADKVLETETVASAPHLTTTEVCENNTDENTFLKTKVFEKEEQLAVEEENKSQKESVLNEEYQENEKLYDIGYPSSFPSTPAYEFPSSPALSSTSDIDAEATTQSRAWKKSIMILWKQVASHRYASLFLQPVTDDIAPNYSNTVYRAMDLSTLKKNLETGVVRTTSDFQRDLMLMFQNALMYNSHEHDVYKMTLEMQNDVMDQVAQFLATQLMMETTKQSTPKGLRRSTLRKSVMSEKVSEARSKRTAAIEGEMKFMKKKTHE